MITINQTRHFSLTEKIQIKCQRFQNSQSLLLQNQNSENDGLDLINWNSINQPKDEKSLKLRSKKLIIYPYSLSNNLLKEALFKLGIKFILTNDIRKASLIIGLKKHLKQNFKLNNLAKQINIPIYTLNQVSFYQVTKFIKFISL